MKTAIKPKDFDKRTALYTLRRVYWRNVFKMAAIKETADILGRDYSDMINELHDMNEWTLQHIRGVQKQLKS